MTRAANLAAVGSNANTGGTLITSGTAVTASGTNVNFDNVIPSWAKRVTIMFSGVSLAGATSGTYVQLGTGSTPTYVTTGYNAPFLTTGATTMNTQLGIIGFLAINAGSAAITASGTMTLTNISGNTWTCHGSLGETSGTRMFVTSGAIALGAALTSIRVNCPDTFDAGTINIFWE